MKSLRNSFENSLQNLDWQEILLKLTDFATSNSAKEKLESLAPLASAELATQSFQEIKEAEQLLQEGLRPFMQSLDLYYPWMTRLKKQAVLKTLEIKDVRNFSLEALALKEALNLITNPWSTRQGDCIQDIEDIVSAIDQIITPGGDIRSDASEKLFQLFREKDKLSRELHNTLDRLVKDHQIENFLQDKYVTTREGRWVLPVKSGMQHFMPGVIHSSSQSKQTVFMEPEKVIPINNRLRQIEVEIEEEVDRLLTDLSAYLAQKAPQMVQIRQVMEDCDIRLAQAQLTQQIKGVGVEFSERILELVELRHPLLALSGKPVVGNNLQLTVEKSILLLSGPNAGGKTVLLKSLGLAAQMARCGLPICALETSRIPFFKSIHISIGDAQSVDQEVSTFAGHMKILNKALELGGPENLILIDEICGSTDPEEGSAIARSFIETFATQGVFGMITSHLGPLKSGWEGSKVLNGSMEYSSKTGLPTYQFLPGIPGDSLAIQTAKRVGVQIKIIERATELLSPETRQRLSGLEQIELMRQEIVQRQDHLRKEMHKALELKSRYERELKKLNKEREDALARSLKKAEKKVDEAISAAKVDDIFRRHQALQEIKFQLPEIVQAKQVVQSTGFENADSFAKKFPPGSKVYVPSLQQDGTIQSTPNSKGEVMVLANSIRLQLPWQDLRLAEKPQNPTSQLVRKSSTFTLALHHEERTLDVRGKTVEEATEELELALDNAARAREDRFKIIHGHGTEALKRAVRTYLSRSLMVKKWKAGTPETGGDGVTWVELNLE